MKKVIMFVVALLLCCGCGNSGKEEFVDKGISKSKIIELVDFKEYILSNGEEYQQMIPVVSGESNDAINVNLEIKSKLTINNKKAMYNDGVVSKFSYSDYELWSSELYSTILSYNYTYYNGDKNLNNIDVYVFSKSKTELVTNDLLLYSYGMEETDVFNVIKNNVEDSDYTLMMLRENGYKLAVNDKNELVILYVLTTDDDVVLKNMVIS